jgi:allophanate hydrolase subunit 2
MIEIISPGLTLIQDKGRENYSNIGVPTSGAWDIEKYIQASMLITGSPYSSPPVFELLSGTLSFHTTKKITLAVVGSARVSIGNTNGALGTVFVLDAGQEILVNHIGPGPAYVAVHGMYVEPVLESCSTDIFSRLGPKPVAAGATYEIENILHSRPRVGRFIKPEPRKGLNQLFHIIRHTHSDIPENTANISWVVSQISRSGIGLNQKNPEKITEISLLPSSTQPSQPVFPGTIQIPPDKNPIILGPDSGTIGGYSTLGTIVQSDVSRLARLEKGSTVNFKIVSVEEAISLNNAWWKQLLSSVVYFS